MLLVTVRQRRRIGAAHGQPCLVRACAFDLQPQKSVNATAASPLSPIVIDTNVALDLWLFGRQGLDALNVRALPLIGTLAMRQELRDVLHHSATGSGPIATSRMPPDAPVIALASWDRHVRLVDAPLRREPAWPRCRDESDQKFVDFALAQRAGWLLTRDRALLKLSRPCRAYGLVIVAPEAATFAATFAAS
jgi:uncharacterized protein